MNMLTSLDTHTASLNIDMFISDIEDRPAIWDSRTEMYSDRGKKIEAWDELNLKYIPNFKEKDAKEKNIAAAQLQRKWKSLRDCFKREQAKRANTKGGSTSSARKPYMYYQKLSFLMNVADTRRERSPATTREQYETKKPNKLKLWTDEENEAEQFSRQLQSSSKLNYQGEDADRNFALSLVPHIKQIPEEFKLDAQTDILMVLKKYIPLPRPHHTQQSRYFKSSLLESELQRTSVLIESISNHQSTSSNIPIEYVHNTPSPALSDSIQSIQSDNNSVIEDNEDPFS